jgi:hypothetical protein
MMHDRVTGPSPNKWLERTVLRRHGFCGEGRQQPRRLRPPLSHTVRLRTGR